MSSRGDDAKSRQRSHTRRKVVLYGGAILLMVVVMFPFLWLLQMSFRSNDDILGLSVLFTPTL